MIGRSLGIYEVTELLGKGGMGEVYRARDPKLKRDVAIKVLPEALAGDPQRLARFEREAQLLASLNHANIAAIYGLDEADGTRFLVLELVEGETLEERLQRGPLELQRALEIGKQVAEALEEAHGKGIVHRDLKPGNVKVTPDGRVKVLDLGLAKALVDEGGVKQAIDLSQSPTMAVGGTVAGVILGTAAYMSPEQARGKEVDARADIWSFGCVMYELLVGRRTFAGETVSDTMAAILKEEPTWSALPDGLPYSIQQLVHRCLQKDARRRLQAIGDARIELDDVLRSMEMASGPGVAGVGAGASLISGPMATTTGPVPTTSGPIPTQTGPLPVAGATPVAPTTTGGVAPSSSDTAGSRGVSWAATALLMVVVATVAGVTAWTLKPVPTAVDRRVTRLALPMIDTTLDVWGSSWPVVAISADGRNLAFVGSDEQGVSRIYIRAMDRADAVPVAGSEGGQMPFFSPDGNWLGFYLGFESIQRVPLSGGSATLVTTDVGGVASWGEGDRIVHGNSQRGISITDASGNRTESIIDPDPDANETFISEAHLLPGGTHLVYSVEMSGDGPRSRIMLLDLADRSKRVLVDDGTRPHYVPTGHLLFGRGESLMAQAFDIDTMETSGQPFAVMTGVLTDDAGETQFAVSDNGTLVYIGGGTVVSSMDLLIVDGSDSDNAREIAGGVQFEWPEISPDGTRVATAIHDDRHGIWVYDIDTGRRIRVSFVGNDGHPVWTPDGTHVVFYSGTRNGGDLYLAAADGSDGGDPTLISEAEYGRVPRSFSPDGRYLVFSETHPERRDDVWLLDMETGEERTLLATPYDESWGMVSPDGKWLAYTSDETGTSEVYLQPFPGPGAKTAASSGGAGIPMWAPDGRTLYFLSDLGLTAVSISGDGPTVGEPRSIDADCCVQGFYWPAPDGHGFLRVRWSDEDQPTPSHINIVLDWFEELRRQASR
ncbi:MAG: protein kinase [Acidobacteriota bacterium]